MRMKKKIKISYFAQSKKWPRRLPKIKKISSKTVNKMSKYFSKNNIFYLNIILSNEQKLISLNKEYKNVSKDTDVLTFVSNFSNKELGKILYCDIFFSIETIEKHVIENKKDIYDHFNHLLIHSILHINGYDHKSLKQFDMMKKEEIKILDKMCISNPYL